MDTCIYIHEYINSNTHIYTQIYENECFDKQKYYDCKKCMFHLQQYVFSNFFQVLVEIEKQIFPRAAVS